MSWFTFVLVLLGVFVSYTIGVHDGRTECRPVVVNNYGFGYANANQE